MRPPRQTSPRYTALLSAALTVLATLTSLSAAVAQPINLLDDDGVLWDIDAAGPGLGLDAQLGGTGAVIGAAGGLRGLPRLCILSGPPSAAPCPAESVFALGAAGGALELGGRQVTLSGESIAGLAVTRKLYVPDGGQLGGFLRVMDVLVNPTPNPVTVTVRFGSVGSGVGFNDLASGAATGVVGSSSGDAAWTPEDAWVVLDDADSAGGLAVGALLGTADAPGQRAQVGLDPYSTGDMGKVAWEYRSVTLQPGERASFLHFFVQGDERAEVNTRLETLAAHPPEVFWGLEQADLGGLRNMVPRRPSVFVLTSDDLGAARDVVETLRLTQSFDLETVDVVDISDEPLPTLATLQQYDVVLCWLRQNHDFRDAAGTLLADYVDGGGHVVVMPFTFEGSVSLTGRWSAGTYAPITSAGSPVSAASPLGTVHVPAHPLWIEVQELENAVSRAGSSSVPAGATRIADWQDGRVAAAVREDKAGRIAALGFYPVSDRNTSDQQLYWNSNTDGDLLLRNALYWAAGYNGTILPGPAPVAATGGPYDVPEGEARALDGLSGSVGHRLVFSWDLDGDGSFGEDPVEQAPNPVFRAFTRGGPDEQPVALQVTDRLGRKASAAGLIRIVNKPPVLQTAVAPMTLDEGEAGSFTATATDPFAQDTVTIRWDFGDGQQATGSPALHAFGDQGVYTVQAIADDGADTNVRLLMVQVRNVPPTIEEIAPLPLAEEGSPATFSATASDPGDDPLTYTWTSGDLMAQGSTVSLTWPQEGIYPLTLTVDDGDGGQDTRTVMVTVENAFPTVQSLTAPAAGNEGAPQAFSVVATDPGADLLTYRWEFSDGMILSGASVTPSFADNGAVDWVLTIGDGTGQLTREGTIQLANVAPTITGIVGPLDVTVGQEFTLTAVFTDPGSADTHTVDWAWTGGGATTGTTATLQFNAPQRITLTLTVTDDDGGVAMLTREIIVRGVAPTINEFTAAQTGSEGEALSFHVAATAPGCSALEATWFFGNGDQLTGMDVSYAYPDDGTFNVEVSVTCLDDDGLSTQAQQAVIANVAPTLAALNLPATLDEGQRLEAQASATDPGAADVLRYTWSVDGQTFESADGALAFTFPDDGDVILQVTVTDGDGGVSMSEPTTLTIRNVAPDCSVSTPQETITILHLPVSYTTTLGALDVPADPLTWTRLEGPEGLNVLAQGGVQWVPTNAQLRTASWEVAAEVSDGDGGVCTARWTLSVTLVDADQDEIPAWWEDLYAFSDDDATDADVDPDMDGATNLEEYLRGTDPRVYDGIVAPILLAPVGGVAVDTLLPELIIQSVIFTEALRLEIEVYDDAALTSLVTGTTLDQDIANPTTAWIVEDELTEDATYWWRARAFTAASNGQWSDVASFRVDAGDAPPSLPVLSRPEDGATVDTLLPRLVVLNAVDPEAQALTYDFEVYSDAALTDRVASLEGVAEGVLGSTLWQLTTDLTEDTSYWWRARASDASSASPWTEPWSFTVNTENRSPLAPVITTPEDGAVITALTLNVEVESIADPDNDAVTLAWALLSGEGFSTEIATGDGVAVTEAGTAMFELADLQEDTRYLLRVWAHDGQSSSPEDTATFTVSTANDPPTAPTLQSPGDGTTIVTTTPTLIVINAVDPEGEALTYDLFVYSDDALTDRVVEITGVPESNTGVTSAMIPAGMSLDPGTWWWSARAVDAQGLAGPEAPAFSFTLEGDEDATLTAPVLQTPADGATWEEGADPEFTWSSSVTSAEAPIFYDLEIFVQDPQTGAAGDRIGGATNLPAADAPAQATTLAVDIPPGRYVWSVTARAAGLTATSDPASFEVTALNIGLVGTVEGGSGLFCAQPSQRASGSLGLLGLLAGLGLVLAFRRR